MEGHAPSFAGATGWLNAPPVEMADLRGNVVVVDFCTYTCINWIRTLPFVRAWDERYRDEGLALIGIHTPEFSFEHDTENIRTALRQMNVTWPIAIDNDYALWEAFANHYWPALYFIDATGRIRHHRFGEGDYEGSELVIQQLLTEAGGTGIEPGFVAADGKGPEAEADWDNLESRETYLGYGQTTGFVSPGSLVPDVGHAYGPPASLALNRWFLAGEWTVTREAATSDTPGGRIGIRFHARDVHLVMGPRSGQASARFRVSVDGEAPGTDRGTDVEADGTGTLVEQRMYQLIRQKGRVADRLFEVEFLDPGAQAIAFTFG